MIVRSYDSHFLACCSDDARCQLTSIIAEIAGETFKASGVMITARNYLDVYIYDRASDKIIPTFEEGQQFTPTELMMTQGTTTPPELLSESDLIGLMDKNGIGTDATIAQHIETIQKRVSHSLPFVGLRSHRLLIAIRRDERHQIPSNKAWYRPCTWLR